MGLRRMADMTRGSRTTWTFSSRSRVGVLIPKSTAFSSSDSSTTRRVLLASDGDGPHSVSNTCAQQSWLRESRVPPPWCGLSSESLPCRCRLRWCRSCSVWTRLRPETCRRCSRVSWHRQPSSNARNLQTASDSSSFCHCERRYSTTHTKSSDIYYLIIQLSQYFS